MPAFHLSPPALGAWHLQGVFKKELEAGALCMGQEFMQGANVPEWVAEMVLTAAAKVFSNSTKVRQRLPPGVFMLCHQHTGCSTPG